MTWVQFASNVAGLINLRHVHRFEARPVASGTVFLVYAVFGDGISVPLDNVGYSTSQRAAEAIHQLVSGVVSITPADTTA